MGIRVYDFTKMLNLDSANMIREHRTAVSFFINLKMSHFNFAKQLQIIAVEK